MSGYRQRSSKLVEVYVFGMLMDLRASSNFEASGIDMSLPPFLGCHPGDLPGNPEDFWK